MIITYSASFGWFVVSHLFSYHSCQKELVEWNGWARELLLLRQRRRLALTYGFNDICVRILCGCDLNKLSWCGSWPPCTQLLVFSLNFSSDNHHFGWTIHQVASIGKYVLLSSSFRVSPCQCLLLFLTQSSINSFAWSIIAPLRIWHRLSQPISHTIHIWFRIICTIHHIADFRSIPHNSIPVPYCITMNTRVTRNDISSDLSWIFWDHWQDIFWSWSAHIGKEIPY